MFEEIDLDFGEDSFEELEGNEDEFDKAKDQSKISKSKNPTIQESTVIKQQEIPPTQNPLLSHIESNISSKPTTPLKSFMPKSYAPPSTAKTDNQSLQTLSYTNTQNQNQSNNHSNNVKRSSFSNQQQPFSVSNTAPIKPVYHSTGKKSLTLNESLPEHPIPNLANNQNAIASSAVQENLTKKQRFVQNQKILEIPLREGHMRLPLIAIEEDIYLLKSKENY